MSPDCFLSKNELLIELKNPRPITQFIPSECYTLDLHFKMLAIVNSTDKSGSALNNFVASAEKQTKQMQHILNNLGEQQSKIPSTLNVGVRKAQEALNKFQAQIGSENGKLVPNTEGLKELQTVFEELAKNVESSDESLTKILDDFREKFPELE